jgi:acyl transferase domain-containing protein/D-arabinose 1-dehydrogenase-like Zn-dependent alcohol dehydrogenase/acyl carrier protein
MNQQGRAIAVVGMALRVPGASTPEEFWKNLVGGVDSISRKSLEEVRAEDRSRYANDPRFVAAKPSLRDVEYFDAALFGLTPSEVERLDPSQRFFLECCWEALERAAVSNESEASVAGVFAGMGTSPGASYFVRNLIDRDDDLDDPIVGIPTRLGNFADFLSSRVSFHLGLTGPSFGVQSACATSLLAVHLAKESLLRGECDVALAGGSSVSASQKPGYLTGVDGMLSASGTVRPFDVEADGTVFGDGVGVVVLQRLSDAIEMGSPIHAVLLGSAITNDGAPRSKPSFVAPSPEGQIQAIRGALSDADVSPESIGYVEAHGTGTRLGDPIEADSLTSVFAERELPKKSCALGSVKANVGHLRQAAGVVGLIKTCLALKHATIPMALHFERASFDIERTPFYLPKDSLEWHASDHPRRASVSAFGFGGTNVHAVLEEAPAVSYPKERPHGPEILTVSGHTTTALNRRLWDLKSYLLERPETELCEVARTLQRGRKPLAHRAALVVAGEGFSPHRLCDLDSLMLGETPHKEPALVFLFPGQGAQRPQMGRQLYESEPVFRRTVERCVEILEPWPELDILALLYSDSTDEAEAKLSLQDTSRAQVALFVVEYALARLFMHWGLQPQVLLGHSIGEYVAACLAGVFSLEQVLGLVATRGRLMQSCPKGSMAVVFLPAEELRLQLPPGIEIAAVNAPTATVISGPEQKVEEFLETLESNGAGFKELQTSHAFHSALMDSTLDAFRKAFEGVEMSPPQIPFLSSSTGLFITPEQATSPDYWVDQIRRSVLFSKGLLTASEENDGLVCLELGPGLGLSGAISHHSIKATCIPTLDGPGQDDREATYAALAKAWTVGTPVDWEKIFSHPCGRKVELPDFPFQRYRYWLEPESQRPDWQTVWLYEGVWREEPLSEDLPPTKGTWLIFQDQFGLGEAIESRLSSSESQVVSLVQGDEFRQHSPCRFTVRPGEKDDLRQVLETMDSTERPISVLHLWNLTGPGKKHNDIEALDESLRNGFYTLIALAQVAFEKNLTENFQILVGADHLHSVDGDGADLHSEKSSLLGPCRVLPLEIPSLTAKCIDLPSASWVSPPQWLVEALERELRTPCTELSVALTQERRCVEFMETARERSRGRTRLRPGMTVLITGGLGGLGLKVARELFESAQVKLLLTSRWAPPPTQEWEQHLDDSGKVGHALRELKALSELGAVFEVIVTDVANPGEFRGALKKAEAAHGRIQGVVHAAGISPVGPALDKTPDLCEPVIGAKVRGAYVLEEYFAHDELDFLIHFSSRASYTPGPGRVDYNAANSILDALARHSASHRRGLRCAIGWGAWLEVGMAARRLESRLESRSKREAVDKHLTHPIIRTRRSLSANSRIYAAHLLPRELWVLDGHRMNGRALMPAAAIIECFCACLDDFLEKPEALELRDVAFLRPLFVGEEGLDLEVILSSEDEECFLEVRSRVDDAEWVIHATCRGYRLPSERAVAIELPDVEFKDRTTPHPLLDLGDRWRSNKGALYEGSATTLKLKIADEFEEETGDFKCHPALLDTTLGGTSLRFDPETVPYALGSFRLYGPLCGELLVLAQCKDPTGIRSVDFKMYNSEGALLIESENYTRSKMSMDVGSSGHLAVEEPGDLQTISWVPSEPDRPEPHEVQIQVVAAGLNFRDVLSALGTLSGQTAGTAALGSECSGIVSAVGSAVSHLQVGDRVVALARGTLASHVITDANLATVVPEHISLEKIAGFALTHLTAEYALSRIAGIRPGERVLIHAASGGVGLAAVQLAQIAGAEIYATAGTDKKRDYLRDLGVDNVFDSRSLDFANQIKEVCDGMDVVVNSLAGEFMQASLGLLRPFGRFVEIGKRDLFNGSQLDLLPFQHNLTYSAFDLGLVMTQRPSELRPVLKDLVDRLADGELFLSPTRVFEMSQVVKGFEHMARAEHIGKVVFKLKSLGSMDSAFGEIFSNGLSVKEGLRVFQDLLSCDATPAHILVFEHPLPTSGEVGRRIESVSRGGQRQRPTMATPFVAPDDIVESTLAQVWENSLGLSPIGVHDDFFELGGNSITAVQVLYKAGRELGLMLPGSALFEYSTVAELAEMVRLMKDTQAQPQEVEAILASLESLTDEEVAAQLAQFEAQ